MEMHHASWIMDWFNCLISKPIEYDMWMLSVRSQNVRCTYVITWHMAHGWIDVLWFFLPLCLGSTLSHVEQYTVLCIVKIGNRIRFIDVTCISLATRETIIIYSNSSHSKTRREKKKEKKIQQTKKLELSSVEWNLNPNRLCVNVMQPIYMDDLGFRLFGMLSGDYVSFDELKYLFILCDCKLSHTLG